MLLYVADFDPLDSSTYVEIQKEFYIISIYEEQNPKNLRVR